MTLKQQEEFLDKLRKRLSKLRREAGLTQESLAKAADLDRAALANIEVGRRRPTVVTMYKISRALKLSMSDIFKDL